MTIAKLSRRASTTLLALTLAACGDSTGPSVQLTEEQTIDMMEAMAAVALVGTGPTMAIVTVSQTVDCPNGGTASINGTVNDHNSETQVTMQVVQGFNGCRATSETSGRLWTFDGDPNITTNFSMTVNPTTGAFTMTGTQAGGIKFSSDLGQGSCAINISINFSGDGETFEGSVSGTACGHNIQQTISVTA